MSRATVIYASIICFLMAVAIAACCLYTAERVMRFDSLDGIMCRDK